MNLKSLIKLKEKEFEKDIELGWFTCGSKLQPVEIKRITDFLSQSIQSAYQLAIKDVMKLECMKEKVDDTLTFNSFVNITEVKNELRNQIKQQLLSLLKEKV